MNNISIKTYVPQRLNRIIKSFWFLEVTNSHESFYEEEIIPDGHHEIIFHINNLPARRKPENGDWIIEPKAFLACQNLKSYALRLLPKAKLFGIRFYPHTLFNFLNFPLENLTDEILSLSDIINADSFWHCITDDPNTTFSNFEKLLTEKLKASALSSGRYDYVDACVSEIFRSKGDVKIENLIAKTGVSGKYLNNIFKRQVGLTPKTLCRIIKLNNFIAYRKNNPERNLTECCYETDYYDQSHLIKAFRKFTNHSPKTFFSDSRYINEFFTNL